MLSIKVHFMQETGAVICVGEHETSQNFLEIEDYGTVLAAIKSNKLLRVVNSELVISENPAVALSEIRKMREILLSQSDVQKLKLEDKEAIDGIVLTAERKKLAEYRQQLRDITKQDPFNVIWPILESM